jgi:hypothetical protein
VTNVTARASRAKQPRRNKGRTDMNAQMRTHLLAGLRDLARHGTVEEIDDLLPYVRRYLACHPTDIADGELAMAFGELERAKQERATLH